MRVFCRYITGLLVFILAVQAQETLGTAGVDYPNHHSIPKTSFSCSEQEFIPGFYADLETDCQVFHFCVENGQESFLCPAGTIFHQASLTCESWDSSNCSLAPLFYSANSGPEMERARRNIFKLIKLRNRSQSRSSISLPAANVFEKITSLYESTIAEDQSEGKISDLDEDMNTGSNSEISRELQSHGSPAETLEGKENESRMNEDLSGLDESIQNDELKNEYNADTSDDQKAEDMEPGILYDPVTEQYFVDYDSSLTENENLDASDPFRIFNYDGFSKRYGLAFNDYVDEIPTDTEGEVSPESFENNLYEFNEMLDTAETSDEKQFLRRMLDFDQPVRRVRRKPMYTVIRDDEGSIQSVASVVQYPVFDSDGSLLTTESIFTDTEVTSELPEREEKIDSEISEISDESHNPGVESSSEVPMTSEEFEQAIRTEMLLPKGYGADLRMFIPSEEEQRDEEFENVSQDYQNDGQYTFFENVESADYESYPAEYNEGDADIVERQESEQETLNEETRFYQDGESFPAEDSVETDDTYVVIPDEYDANDLDQYPETNQRTESLDGPAHYGLQSDVTYDYDDLRDYFLSRYASPAAYAPGNPYWFQPSEYYFRNEYGGRQQFNGEDFYDSDYHDSFRSPSEYAHNGAVNDQEFQYGFAGMVSPEEYFSRIESDPNNYEPPTSLADVYDYSSENGYPYGHIYGNPYSEGIEHFGYVPSEMEDSAESSVLNETPDADLKVNRDYSEPETPSWLQGDSSESSDTEELELTASSILTEDFLADLYAKTSNTDEDLNAAPEEIVGMSVEGMKQAETFYLFDFDGEEEGQVKFDANAKILEPGTVEPWQPNESSKGDQNGMNVESKQMEIAPAEEDFDSENVASPVNSASVVDSKLREITDSLSFQTTESSLINEKPVTLSSALEHLAALNAAKMSRESDASNILSRDAKFLNSKAYLESLDFGPDGVANIDQQSDLDDVSAISSTGNDFFPRTGNTRQSRVSKLSEIQERIRSLKQGKFGAFKKYIKSERNKD